MRLLFIVLLSFSCSALFSQKKLTVEGVVISGFVKDSVSGKPVRNVQISIPGSNKKTATNKQGKYSLILHSKPDSVFFCHKKYILKKIKLQTLNNDVVLRKKDVSIESKH